MPLLKRLTVLAAKAEGTIGTAETLTNAESNFNPYNIEIQNTIAIQSREDAGSFNRRKAAVGAYGGTVRFTHDIQWDETSTLPGWMSVFFPACGWVDSTSTLTPRSEYTGANVKSLTIGVYQNGMKKFITGAMGNWTAHFPTGDTCFVDFEFTGVWQAPVDAAILVPTHPTDNNMRYVSSTTTWNSIAPCPSEVVMFSGNNVILRECPSTASGYISAAITDRVPTITMDPEAELVATADEYGNLITPLEAAFSLTIGTTMTWSAPKAQLTSVQEGDREMLRTNDLEFVCNKNGATKDEELSITLA